MSTAIDKPKSTYYQWIALGLLWVVALLNYMDRQMLSTMMGAIATNIPELEKAENFGRLMAVFLWIYGFVSPFSGIIADKANRKWIIVFSLFIWSAITWAMGFATSFNQLYWLRAAMGVSEAMYIPAGLSLIADYHPSHTRSLAIGIHMTGIYAGQALGGFGATIAGLLSWQNTFRLLGIVGVLYAGLLVLFLREIEQRQRKAAPLLDANETDQSLWTNMRSLVKNASFWLMLVYFTIPSLPGWGIKNWLPTLFAKSLGIDMRQAGPLSSITVSISSFIGVLIGGIVSDKWVQKHTKGRIYTSAIGLGLTVPALLLLAYGHTPLTAVSAAFCFGVGFGMFDANNMPILCQLVSAKQRATAYGFMNMAGVFAGAYITSWLGKSTDSGTLGRDFAFLAAIVAVALMVQLVLLSPKEKTDS